MHPLSNYHEWCRQISEMNDIITDLRTAPTADHRLLLDAMRLRMHMTERRDRIGHETHNNQH